MPTNIILDSVRSFLSLQLWENAVPALKAFGVVVSLFSIAGIVVVAIKSTARARMQQPIQHTPTSSELAPVHTSDIRAQHIARKQWMTLVEKLEQQTEPRDYKLAIIEADALVDYVLQEHGYIGETMADRIRAIQPGDMATVGIEELWVAHKVRNDIAHSPQRIVSSREGQETLRRYKHVLEELHAL